MRGESAKLSGASAFPEVLRWELQHLLTVLILVSESLATLSDVLQGRMQDSTASRLVCNALWKKEVPTSWQIHGTREGYGASSLPAWQTSMRDRVHTFRGWYLDGPPLSFWLGGFASTRLFVAAVMQQHAKKEDVSLQDLQLVTKATCFAAPSRPSHPEDSLGAGEVQRPAQGVFIHGLTLRGARWTDNQLDFGLPGDEVSSTPWLPLLHLLPVPAEQSKRWMTAMNYFACPVYRHMPKRSGCMQADPLIFLDLASTQAPCEWALRGVALFLECID
jgi:dynein heavy chain